ncbi:hypothetical protein METBISCDRAFT_24207 [Metschnikowia bicuspidata]|uniref:FHA domain-containing protein n=1 Tax=Metschnikowia bicuspidata TaxID=27322 RepID=A0A4P9ZCA6_9ASCO|nr:hypothetical protein METBISCDRAFT_24207 [Metschnikowia bicuspidata]
MSETQFPPSSPVLNASDHCDPFTVRSKDASHRGRAQEYPTPNPSSTVGYLSSPSRQEDEPEEPEEPDLPLAALDQVKTPAKPARTTVSINREFNILNPDKAVLRVPLVATRPQITIGRSSKASDYCLRSVGPNNRTDKIDKTVSRRHVLVNHYATKMVLKCLGHNGFSVTVPKVCGVKQKAASGNEYELLETAIPLDMTAQSKTLRLDHNSTEFHVMHGESVEMPRFANVLLQIRDHVVLVNPDDYDEELTDEESSNASDAVETLLIERITGTEAPAFSTLVTSSHALSITPRKAVSVLCSHTEETTPYKSKTKENDENDDDDENKQKIVLDAIGKSPASTVPKPITPLANRTNVTRNTKRRAASEEIVYKKPNKEAEHDSEGKPIISQEYIRSVEHITEIENILINHLAFSRLSSTPPSVLHSILAAVAKLSLKQLRTVLHNVSCIGVIYRQGKDAAGKPLEEEYFYEPEKDHDQQRNLLLLLIKGHGGLRACRKTHKQYYWKKPAAKK